MYQQFDFIADGLAEQGYAVCDQFLSQNEVRAILQTGSFDPGASDLQRAGIGKRQDLQINESIRGDYIKWLEKNSTTPALAVYLSRLEELMSFLNRSLYLSLKDYEVHLTVYPPGSFYKRHLDQFRSDDHRKLSVICYLNENWTEQDGGQLRMYPDTGVLDIEPIAGRLVCFRSDHIEHEVLPASRNRLSITGWILDQYSALRHL